MSSKIINVFFAKIFIECKSYYKLKLAKRLTKKEKDEIIQGFTEGNTLNFLSKKFDCTRLTIIRNLKKNLGEKKYKEINNLHKPKKENIISKKNESDITLNTQTNNESLEKSLSAITIENNNQNESDFSPESSFLEITPLLDHEIEDYSRKELSSVPISDIDFPEIVYMIVNKSIELEIKLLRDYPDWEFLPTKDLNRKTIEIYLDLKVAKRFCHKDQKVIKIPNTNVFRLAAPLLSSRGISRIVSADKLISL